MTNQERAGRLLVLESMCTTAMALVLANSRNDPNSALARDLLNVMRDLIDSKARDLPANEREEAATYADELFSQVLRNLKNFRDL